MRFATLFLIAVLVMPARAQPARAQPVVVQTERVVPLAGADRRDRLGEVVALDGTLAVVTAPLDNVGTTLQAGSVTVFERNGTEWRVVARLVSPAPVRGATDGNFGLSVALDGTRIVVGAPYDAPTTDRGAVYVFERDAPTEWRLAATLSDGDPTARFGFAVALSGDEILASSDPTSIDFNGRARVFRRVNGAWTEPTELVPSVLETSFGARVALDGNVAVVSDDRRGDTAATVFERTDGAWTETARLAPFTDGRTPSLSVSGARLAFGLSRQFAPGEVIVYQRTADGWTPDATLTTDADQFGEDVSLDGDRLSVGAARGGVGGSGVVVLFERAGGAWAETVRLSDEDARDFGAAVSLDGDRVLVGAPGTQGESGGAQVFEASEGDAWTAVGDLRLGIGRDDERFGSSVALSGGRLAVAGIGTTSVFGLRWEEGPPMLVAERRLRSGFGEAGDIALSGSHVLNASPDGGVTTLLRTPTGWEIGSPITIGSDAIAASVVLDGDRALVGRASASGGSATIYEFDGERWQWAADLTRPLVGLPRYGRAVALDDGRALVASQPFRGDGLFGRVDVFEFDGLGWQHVRTLEESGSVFGAEVALSGARAAVGAPNFVGPLDTSETVSVFGGTSWVRQAVFEGAGARRAFGSALALDGDRLVVGAPGADVDGQDTGAAYLYEFDGVAWSSPALLRPEIPSRSFGAAVDIEGRRIAVGAPRENADAPDGGAVYLFQTTTTVASDRLTTADAGWLSEPSPNPAVGQTVLGIALDAPGTVTLRVVDLLGRTVQSAEHSLAAGPSRLHLDLSGLATGGYVVQVRSGADRAARRLVVVR